jgi:hypothetical protein
LVTLLRPNDDGDLAPVPKLIFAGSFLSRMIPSSRFPMLILASVLWGRGNIANQTRLTDLGPLRAFCLQGGIVAVTVRLLSRFEQVQSVVPG